MSVSDTPYTCASVGVGQENLYQKWNQELVKKVTKKFDEAAHGHHYIGMEVLRASMGLS